MQQGNPHFDPKGRADGKFLFGIKLFPIAQQKPHAEKQIERHADIANACVDSVGIVSFGRHRVVDRQQQDAQFRNDQKHLRSQIRPPSLSRFFLHQNGDVSVEQVHNQHHGSDKNPV